MNYDKIKVKIKSLKLSRNEAVEYAVDLLNNLNLEEAKMLIENAQYYDQQIATFEFLLACVDEEKGE